MQEIRAYKIGSRRHAGIRQEVAGVEVLWVGPMDEPQITVDAKVLGIPRPYRLRNGKSYASLEAAVLALIR